MRVVDVDERPQLVGEPEAIVDAELLDRRRDVGAELIGWRRVVVGVGMGCLLGWGGWSGRIRNW